MFQYFPKTSYQFGGLSLEVTDIFRQVNVIFDNSDAITSSTLLPGERPDQVSSRLYSTPDYYWAVLLANNVKNPFTDWAQTQDSYTKRIEQQYPGWEFQFANTSQFIPPAGSTGFTGSNLSRYDGVNLDGILPGDLLIYETGSGPYRVKCYGVGGVTSSDDCGSPHYGQAIVPDNFDTQKNVVQVVAGNYFTASLDSNGYVYVWGQNISLGSNFSQNGSLYRSKTGGYSFIEASGNRLIAINSTGSLECFGACSDFTEKYTGTTGLIKTRWTTGLCGGIGIKSDYSVVSYGITAPVQLYDADCGSRYCIGVFDGSYGANSYGLTAFGVSPGFDLFTTIPGITGITLVSTNFNHALAMKQDGTVYAWGSNSQGQTEVPTKSFKYISAGREHSAGVDVDGKLVTWGKFLIYGENSCAGQSQTRVTGLDLDGEFDSVASGLDHLVLTGAGTNKKYIGFVDYVDNVFKRIFVNTTQFAESQPLLFDDPSGTVVSVWRYDTSQNRYTQIKTIQNQLLSIQKYLDSTKYIQQNGFIVDCSVPSNWETVYLPNYKSAETNLEFITFRKELMDLDLINQTKINKLSLSNITKLASGIQEILSPQSTTNEIRVSNL